MGDGESPATWWCVYHFAVHEYDVHNVTHVMTTHADVVQATLAGDRDAQLVLGDLVVKCLTKRLRSRD